MARQGHGTYNNQCLRLSPPCAIPSRSALPSTQATCPFVSVRLKVADMTAIHSQDGSAADSVVACRYYEVRRGSLSIKLPATPPKKASRSLTNATHSFDVFPYSLESAEARLPRRSESIADTSSARYPRSRNGPP
jgi:hypothetical protein